MFRNSQIQAALGLFALLLAGFMSTDSGKPADHITWETNWDAAVEKAIAEKKPIMIHFNMDDEPACKNISKVHFRNKKVIELSKEFVCVVGSLGDHKDETEFKEPGKCGRFGCVTCAEHRKIESLARANVMETSKVTAPQFVFVTPDLKIMVRRPWDLPSTELISLMQRSLYYYNPDLAPGDYEKRAKELIDNLIKDGKSDNAAKRKKALDAMAKRDEPAIIQFLIEQTDPKVDQIKRLEAIAAIGEAGNATCLPALLSILKDRSRRIRTATLIALNKLLMIECVDPIAKAFGVERDTTNKAIAIKTVVNVAPENKTSRKLLNKGLKSQKKDVRAHSVRATIGVDIDGKEFARLIKLAKGDQELSVRACACHAATTLAIRYRDDNALHISEADKKVYAKKRKQIVADTKKKLRPALKKVQDGDREEKLREFAKLCLEALDSQDFVDLDGDLDEFFKDDELMESTDGDGKKKRRRGGRGGGRGGGR